MAIALTLILLSVIVVLGFGLATLGIQNLTHADAQRYSKAALFAAEAGANDALLQLNGNPALETQYAFQSSTPETATVNITNNLAGAVNSTKTAPNGVVVPAGTAYVLATGNAKSDRFHRQVGVMVTQAIGGSPFKYAAFGNTSMGGNGSPTTNSYNSTSGAYTSTATNTGGNIGTNSVDPGSPSAGIKLSGSPNIQGHVDVGEGGDPSVVITGGGTFQGSGAQTKNMQLPIVNIPNASSVPSTSTSWSGTVNPGTYGVVTIAGAATLNPGTYYVKAIVGATGSPKELNLAGGQVTIYIVGRGSSAQADLDFGGNVKVNINSDGTPGNPGDLVFMAGEDVKRVKVKGTADVSFAAYAPKAQVDIGGTGELYGSVIGQSVDLGGNGDIHYDMALSAMDVLPSGIIIKSWQRH